MGQRLFLSLILLVFGVGFNKHDPPSVSNTNKNQIVLSHPLPPIAYIAYYARVLENDNKKYSSDMSNVILAYRDSPSIYFNLWVLRAVWKEEGLLVEVEMAPGHDVHTFFPAALRGTLEKRLISTRHVKPGELRFLEKDFITSLPLAMENTGKVNMGPGSSQPLYFRVSPRGSGPGDTMGYYWDDEDDHNKSNPGYAKLMADFRSAIPWVFAEWLIEDEYEIDEKWLADMRKMWPKREFDK